MSNRDLLTEALADAKAVKEMAITNAKAALEEAFAPQLKTMLEQKIMGLDEEEEELKKESKMSNDDDDAALEELLRELEGDEDEDEDAAEADKDAKDKDEKADKEDKKDDEGDEDDEIDFDSMTEEEIIDFIEKVVDTMVDNQELKVDGVPVTKGEDGDMDGMGDMGDMDMDAEMGGEDVDIDMSDLGGEDEEEIEATDDMSMMEAKMEAKKNKQHNEKKSRVMEKDKKKGKMMENFLDEADNIDEAYDTATISLSPEELEQVFKYAAGLITGLIGGGAGLAYKDEIGAKMSSLVDKVKSKFGSKAKMGEAKDEKMEAELEEALRTIKTLKSELFEINLLNSKLLYTNKIFKAKNLTEVNKVKVLAAFDKAESVKEVKLVFETLSENLVKTANVDPVVKSKPELVRESKGFASKSTGGNPIATKKPVVDMDPMIERMKKLAGLK